MKRVALLVCLLTCVTIRAADNPRFKTGRSFTIDNQADAVSIKNPAGQIILTYQLTVPAGSPLSVDSGCYFHPFKTPGGKTVTAVAPEDHRHHRGIFLAWVEMHGAKDADFWGWGEHAPVKGRKIFNRSVGNVASSPTEAGFHVRNDWLADSVVLLNETLTVRLHERTIPDPNASRAVEDPATPSPPQGEAQPRCYILDLTYELMPKAELTLAQWAFSGFCVRSHKEGQLEVRGQKGIVDLPNPNHLQPRSDWPNAAWYGFTFRGADGAASGVSVLNHPGNPDSLWHNHRDIRMLNPCIVAPGPLVLAAGEPLILRYRVIAHDGPAPARFFNTLAQTWTSGS